MFTIISAGIAPGLALLSFFYLKDKYEPEPIFMVVRTFLFGVLLVFPVMVLQFGLHEEILNIPGWADAFLISGSLEEFFKWFILYFAAYQHIEFNDPYDGIIYGASLSLGFATAENVLYLFANGVETAMLRAFLPVPCHALFGVMMGYYLSRVKFAQFQKTKNISLFYSLVVPIAFHGLYDFIILNHFKQWLLIMLPFMLFLWWLGLRKVKHAQQASRKAYFR